MSCRFGLILAAIDMTCSSQGAARVCSYHVLIEVCKLTVLTEVCNVANNGQYMGPCVVSHRESTVLWMSVNAWVWMST